MEVSMSRYLGRIVLLVLGASLVVAGWARADGIKPKDLKRSYAAACLGTTATGPFAQIGQVDCDGKDTCVGTLVVNGGDGIALTANILGHFTLGSNGVGFILYQVSGLGPTFPLPIQFVVQDGGREIRGMPLVAGYNVICELKEQ
jgi:hypothetical protein